MVTILLVIIFLACVPEGNAFTAGAGVPQIQGKRTQVRIVLSELGYAKLLYGCVSQGLGSTEFTSLIG